MGVVVRIRNVTKGNIDKGDIYPSIVQNGRIEESGVVNRSLHKGRIAKCDVVESDIVHCHIDNSNVIGLREHITSML